jgi:hypothetical protein
MNEMDINKAIDKYNRLFLYFIMKAKKKYTKLYDRLSKENIKSIYEEKILAQGRFVIDCIINKINESITDIEAVEVQVEVHEVEVHEVEEQVEVHEVEEQVEVHEVEEVRVVEEQVEVQVEEQVEVHEVEVHEVEEQVEVHEVEVQVEEQVEVHKVEVHKVEVHEVEVQEVQPMYCVPCEPSSNQKPLSHNPELNSSCACCVQQIQTFPLYDELYECMNPTQKNLFTKQIYFCTKIIFDNKSDEEIIKKMCTKILDLGGIVGLEFVDTILKSL